MKIVNNLLFGGNCREAFETYAKILGGRITAMHPFGDVPEEAALGEEFQERIMHAWLKVGDQAIMGCDAPPSFNGKPGGFTVAIHLSDAGEARRIFDALAVDGEQIMPFGSTFWSPGFGMVTDRFGTPWTINVDSQ